MVWVLLQSNLSVQPSLESRASSFSHTGVVRSTLVTLDGGAGPFVDWGQLLDASDILADEVSCEALRH